jgi:Protein of unknown function (DUF2905)
METAGKVLLVTAVVLALVGAALLLAGKLGLSRVPGDIVIRHDGLTVFIPLGSMLLLSLLASLVAWLIRRL